MGLSSPDASNYTSGLNNFVAPEDGTYYVEMTGTPGVKFNLVVTRGADFNTQPANQLPSAQDITATELSGDNKLGGVLGYLQSPNGIPGTDYYSVNANAGDNLHFATSTPAGGPDEFINNLYPELLLYDPNGNLVAVAAGNASDGRNSVIDFTVPDGDAGTWVIEVTASPNTPTADLRRVRHAGDRCHRGIVALRCHGHHARCRCAGPAAHGHHRHLQRSG